MNNYVTFAFLVPVIALILVVVFYFILSNKTTNKATFKRFTLITLAMAFLLNFIWEVVQMPLYKDASFDIQHIVFCAIASVADAIIVLFLYFCFALIYKNPFWVHDLTLPRLLILMLVGSIGAIGAELYYVSSGNWTYAKSMPTIPIINVGLSPVLQFMFLPGCIYYLCFKMKMMKKNTFSKPNYRN